MTIVTCTLKLKKLYKKYRLFCLDFLEFYIMLSQYIVKKSYLINFYTLSNDNNVKSYMYYSLNTVPTY